MKIDSVFGIEQNVFFTGCVSLFTDTASKMVYSVIPLFLLSIGVSKTSLIAGVLYDKVSPEAPFCFASVMAFAAMFFIFVFIVAYKSRIKVIFS
jgi:hypothetical protein